ncbi:MAG: two-component system sensor histidine kinase NtrB [Pyrinomonadaceae bacterium]
MAEDKERGEIVYSRRTAQAGKSGGSAETPGALLRSGKVSPTLPTLLGGFVLLIGLVYGLGYSSVSEMERVSDEVRNQSQLRSARTKLLLEFDNALSRLNDEARARDAAESRGGINNPFDLRLRRTRGDVRDVLASFERRLPVAQTPEGRAFRENLNEYIGITEDLDRYSTEGFELYRQLNDQLDAFVQGAQKEQQDLEWQARIWENEAKSKLDYLTILAVITGIVVAGATTWEVQRRFRQLRRSLREVSRERQFNAQMLEGLVSAVAAIDSRQRIRSANVGFWRLFPAAVVGSLLQELDAGPEAARMLANATAAPVAESVYHGRWTLPTAAQDGGRARSFDVYSSPLDIDGERGQILTLVDVTEVAEAEREVRRTEALAAVGQAAAQVAHEIKNPLGSIRLGVAMLRDMTSAREAHNTIDLVERGIDHLNKLTVDVTQYSREKELSLSVVNISELLEASLELITEPIRRKRTPIVKHYSAEPLTGQLDVDQLRQVFVNLLANAVDASDDGAPVTITTALVNAPAAGGNGSSGEGPRARVTIADEGVGMDEPTRARIFEPFFTTKKRGTGLGLAIVNKIVTQHGGTITVESAPGKGTKFHIELPLKK